MQKKVKIRRSNLQIMLKLIVLVKPLLHIMILAVFLGVLGYFAAISLTVLASHTLLIGLGIKESLFSLSLGKINLLLVVIALSRGFLHYAEQYCNHFIAFKLLAIIRHKVFAALRTLCPAKLEGKERGNLISVITTDVELLEVFYAHTISPIAIAIITSLSLVIFIGHFHLLAGMLSLLAYLTVGLAIPFWNNSIGTADGMHFRNEFGKLNSFLLDSLRGLDETIQYEQSYTRLSQINQYSAELTHLQKKLNTNEGKQRSITSLSILVFSFSMLFLTMYLYHLQLLDFSDVLTCTVCMIGSFGPTVALSNLSNNLTQTFASGERVLSILEEVPQVSEIPEQKIIPSKHAGNFIAETENITFSYNTEKVLKNFSYSFSKGKMIGILGDSGCGKSTLLKLLMRFWETDEGIIYVNQYNINELPTHLLRNTESYVTQETHLFHDSIANNISIAKSNATKEEIIIAAQKASIHDFIMKLPNGYDTNVSELGDNLSSGEKQRIGIARAFIHDAPLVLLDEPTSNLDSLNEGIILSALSKECKNRKDKTVILVSHRKSTLKSMDEIVNMNNISS